jgi:hypothetical protein
LQSGENFDDGGAPFVERFLKQALPVVERFEARSRRFNAGLDFAHVRGRVDQLLIERAPIVSDRLYFVLELGLVFRRLALRGARGFELLIARFQRLGVGVRLLGWLDGRRRKGRRGHLRCRRPADAGRDLGRRRLRQRGQIGSERQQDSQSRAKHKARIGVARPAENHRLQG